MYLVDMSAAVAPIARNALSKALQRAFGFSETDLRLNRSGKLSGAQKIRLLDRLGPVIGAGILSVFIWMVMWLIYASVIRKLPVSDAVSEVAIRVVQPQIMWSGKREVYGQTAKAPLVYSGAAVSLVMLVLGGIFTLPFRLIRDMLGGVVFVAYGRVETEQGENKKRGQPDGVVRYYFRLRDEEIFEVSPQAHDAIDSGGLYAVYYLPRSRVIVSIDPRMDASRLPTPLSEMPAPSFRLHTEPSTMMSENR